MNEAAENLPQRRRGRREIEGSKRSLKKKTEHKKTQNITEGLNRQDAAGPNVFAGKQRLEGPAAGLISGTGEQAEEAPLSFEQAADSFGDGEGPVAIRNRREDVVCKFFGKQGSALGLIPLSGTKVSRAASKSYEMFAPARRATKASKTSLEPAAGSPVFFGKSGKRVERPSCSTYF